MHIASRLLRGIYVLRYRCNIAEGEGEHTEKCRRSGLNARQNGREWLPDFESGTQRRSEKITSAEEHALKQRVAKSIQPWDGCRSYNRQRGLLHFPEKGAKCRGPLRRVRDEFHRTEARIWRATASCVDVDGLGRKKSLNPLPLAL